jgi:RNA polymerase sigma factor (sigma-70 family)
VTDVHARIDAVVKLESARIVAALMRIVHDVGLADELAQDALVAALEQWPAAGVPDNPGAWLMTTAKRRAVDHVRRAKVHDRKAGQYARELDAEPSSERDDVLRLMFISCHPVLPTEERVALTLRVVGGLTAAEIARAFLVTEPVVARRIATAKRTLAEAGVPFALPDADELAQRLSSVLEVVYLIFNEGYSASSGDDLIRPALCLDALRLGRLLAELAPHEPEVHGLVALMEIQASRSAARTGPAGEPVQLHEQNRGRWDQLLIRRGFTAMLRARELGGTPGQYVLQAAIAVCHAQARTAQDTDWTQIAALYDALARQLPTPIVQLNRAVAVGMAHGPQAGLGLVDALRADATLRDYHLLPGCWALPDADLATGLERRAESGERVASLRAADLDGLWERADVALRERTLWRLLHESGAGVRAVLGLNVEDLDLDDRRARSGTGWVSWRAGTARLLPELLAGRTRGPVFLADRRPGPARMPAEADRCPDTGRGRLSYERAEYLFKQATGATLRRLKPR